MGGGVIPCDNNETNLISIGYLNTDFFSNNNIHLIHEIINLKGQCYIEISKDFKLCNINVYVVKYIKDGNKYNDDKYNVDKYDNIYIKKEDALLYVEAGTFNIIIKLSVVADGVQSLDEYFYVCNECLDINLNYVKDYKLSINKFLNINNINLFLKINSNAYDALYAEKNYNKEQKCIDDDLLNLFIKLYTKTNIIDIINNKITNTEIKNSITQATDTINNKITTLESSVSTLESSVSDISTIITDLIVQIDNIIELINSNKNTYNSITYFKKKNKK